MRDNAAGGGTGRHAPTGCASAIFNLDQQPAALLPSGVTQRDLPVGLRLVGANGGDDLVPRMRAPAYEAVAPFLILEAPRQC